MSGLPLGSAIGGIVVVHSPTLAFVLAAAASVLAAMAAQFLVPRKRYALLDASYTQTSINAYYSI